MGMGHAGSSYEYGGSAGGIHTGQPLSIDTGMNARNVPTSPASTPPGNSQGVQYQNNTQPAYHNQPYSAPGSYPPYGQQQQGVPQQQQQRYGPMQTSPNGVKTEMGPPGPTRSGAENDHHESKPHDGYSGQQDADGEHEGEYTHNSASYDARRPSYNYKPNQAQAGPVQDPSHISPEMTHSPHQNGSGRATPRTANPYNGYNTTPQRGGGPLPSSNLNYVVSNDTRGGAPNGPDPGYQTGYQPAPQYPSMNGTVSGTKRGREDDEQVDPYGRPMSASGDPGLKRQRTDPGVMSARPISQPHSVKAGGNGRR